MGGGKELALASGSGSDANRRAELESSASQKVLDTPRTREACRRLGLVLEDLHFRGVDAFYIPGDMKEKQQLRFEHYEKKRKDRMGHVLAERAKVIAAAAKKGEVPGVQSGQFLSMLESLFEKEAKRLETDLKGQLRQHSALVKENEEQLSKEAQMQEKLMAREAQRRKAEQLHKEFGEKVKEKTNTSQGKSNEIMGKIKTEFEEKQQLSAKAIVAEEERMAKFLEDRVKSSSEKSKVFRERVEQMKDKTAQRLVEKRVEGEAKLVELQKKVESVYKNREAEQSKRQVRSEEQHLHIMDVRENKDRLDRVDGYRRGELKEQIDSNVERIETLLALKDQLLNQRRGRNLKQAATQGARGINLKRDCLPGPGAYEPPTSCMREQPVPKMSKSNAPGMLDQEAAKTAKNPAPGAYDAKVLPNGDYLEGERAIAFSKRNRESFLDDAVRSKEYVPAPGRYESKSSLDTRTTAMRRDRIEHENLDKHSHKQFPQWARPGTLTPGPAGYSVDDYTRKEVLRRAQQSLPNLTRDMLRPGAAVAQ